MRNLACLALSALLMLSACGSSDQAIPGDMDDHRPYSGIAEGETVKFSGNEPFWGGEVSGSSLTYTTPENIEGATIVVERFAGRGGLSYSGELDGETFVIAFTPGECSDGMSDRTYPFVATLQIGADQRNGCAWTAGQPFSGPEAP